MRQIYKGKIALLTFLLFFIEFTSAFSADISTTAQGGKWSDKTTWIGGVVPIATDNVIITSTVTANGGSYSSTSYLMTNLTVNSGGKIIREKNSGGLSYLKISGNLTNNGEIIDYNDYFDIDLLGNLINNGVLKPRYINMKGDNQKLSGTAAIECKQINLNMTDEFAVAVSNLMFKNCRVNSGVSTTNKKLKMGKYSLSLFADSIRFDSYYGTVSSSSEIVIPIVYDGTGILNAENSLVGGTIYGNAIVKSASYAFFKDLTIEGNLTLDEGVKVSSQVNLTKLRVKGDFTNYADLNKDTVKVRQVKFAPRSMYLFVYGNSNNLGSTGISTVYPTTNGKTISLAGNYDANVYIQQAENSDKPGGKVLINSEVNISGKLDVYANLEIALGGVLSLLNKTLTSPVYVRTEVASITNKGTMNRYHKVGNSWGYRTFSAQPGTYADFELREWSDRIEGVDVTVYNGATYPGLPGSLKRWWHIEPVGTGSVKYYTLKLYYDDTMLNGQKEENLKVYRSTDKGKNWEVVSANEFSVIDTVQNIITVGRWDKTTSMLSEFGDFVISSGDGSVPVGSPVKIDLVGRPDIRIGAPNPFKIHVYNVTDFPTTPMLIAVNIASDMRFKEIHLPYNDGVEIIPIDSLGNPNDDTQVFYIPYLDPNEHYSFDVIVYGIADDLKSAKEHKSTITVGQIGGKLKDEAKDMISEGITGWVSEWANRDLSDEENAQQNSVLGLERNYRAGEKEKYGKTVTTLRDFTKSAVEKLADKHPVSKMIFKIGETVESVYNVKDKLRRRLFYWFYKEIGLIKEDEMNGKQIQGRLVKSWDPNEMIGPAGYGKQNFMSSIPQMNYTVMFENKKEATAPAYRIQIIDTLSAVFDPETVKFLETSHSVPNYNWKMERNGNILKWDIEGIELPPNATPPEGEGFVSFSVEPVEGLPSGTLFENRATIIFDMNAPIMTNTWQNVLDTNSPYSIMDPISYTPGDSLINLSCNANDADGSGINKYMFYSSINSGPFSLISESFENSLQYPVSKDERNSYRFYAITTDNVGNIESSLPALVELKSFPLTSKPIEKLTDQLKIYPNPTTGIFSVDFLCENQTVVDFQLYSVTGKLLKNERIGLFESGKQHFNIDISDIKQGVYLAKVLRNNKAEIYKIIKKD